MLLDLCGSILQKLVFILAIEYFDRVFFFLNVYLFVFLFQGTNGFLKNPVFQHAKSCNVHICLKNIGFIEQTMISSVSLFYSADLKNQDKTK